MRSAFSRFVIALLLSVMALGAAGCIGSFKLTSGIADWNRSASDEKWVNELIFLGLVIIPVYEIAILIDAIILNSIEFWGGKNPVESSTKQVGPAGDAPPDTSVVGSG